ncbi:MAG: primosomal protein N' [Bacteroidia bacterium]|nr:primosomal protein N' [Bacteroidia bacterium]
MPTIAEVILPLPIRSNFFYLIKEEQLESVESGKRVLVSFGKSKIYTGAIRRIISHPTEAQLRDLKPIEEILDEVPILGEKQLQLFEWMAFYYMCTPGEVLKAALPAGLKPESSLRVTMVDDLNWKQLPLDDKEFMLMEALSIQSVLDFKEVSAIWSILNPSPRLKTMQARGLIRLFQLVEPKYKPKYKTFLKLAETWTSEAKLNEAFDAVTRSAAQENLLMRIVSAWYKGNILPKSETLKELDITAQVVKTLVNKGFIEEEEVLIDRLEMYGYKVHEQTIVLNPAQETAIASIRSSLTLFPDKPILLNGITGSGKTHIYINLIREVLAQGRQVLYLLPEITLTKQIIDRVKSAFGETVGIYHSKFNDQERVEIWYKVLRREYQVVIGVRSAVFLPFQDLGMIVVDEEHDSSFKQHEPAPRYNARDVAIYYGVHFRCPVILGSATPSFESYQNARLNKYTLVELKQRATTAVMPQIRIVDMRIQKKQRQINGVFSKVLQDTMTETLARGEQIILFQNRRGFSPYLICETCGYVPQCINCDISTTYHKGKEHLRCHYCGHTDFNVNKCDHCGNYTLKRAGAGTERIEEEVAALFPQHVIQRMDLDTTRTKMGYQHIITRFENRQIDILVGTQMVSKGLDFENVTLVGVINADNLLTFPDFRAYENAYQLLTQVSGRAGRSHKKGQVIIQSMMPDNVVLNSVEKPFEEFFLQESPTRQQIGYPPFTRLVKIEFKHKDRNFIEAEALRLNNLLKPLFGENLLGPDYALVARVRNQYRMQFLIKAGKNIPAAKLREVMSNAIEKYYETAPVKNLRIILDIDPF